MPTLPETKAITRSWLLLLGALLLLALPLGCAREEPAEAASAQEGVQVADMEAPEESWPPQTAPPPPAPAPEPRERPRRIPAQEVQPPPPAPKPQPAPQPVRPLAPATPPPPPQTMTLTVPSDTEMKVKMLDGLDSGTSQPGDRFQATLVDSIIVGDRVVLPSGSTVDGTVTDVIPAKKGLKESGGSLLISFDRITTPQGTSLPMEAAISEVAKSTKKKSGTIAGSAVGGAILGKVLGGDSKDAAIGAVIGGAIGTGIAAGTKGTEAKIEAGTEITIALQEALEVTLER